MKTMITTAVLCLALTVNAGPAELETDAGTKHLLFDLEGFSDLDQHPDASYESLGLGTGSLYLSLAF